MKTIAAIVTALSIFGAASIAPASAQSQCIPQYDSSGAMTGCWGD